MEPDEFCNGGWQLRDCEIANQSLSAFNVGPVPCYVGIVSDTLSCVASVLIIGMYIAWKDYREMGAQTIITFIAISDFFTASAYLIGSVNLLMFHTQAWEQDQQRCNNFVTVCKIESFVVTCATMSSYFWTIILAVYFFLTIVFGKARLAMKLLPTCHLFAWGLPVVVAYPLLILGKLAYAPFVSGVWCYMEIFRNAPPFHENSPLVITLIQLPELTSYSIILILYIITRLYFNKRTNKGYFVVSHAEKRHKLQDKVHTANKMFLLIPVAFVFLRAWCTAQYFYTVHLAKIANQNPSGGFCIPRGAKVGHVILGMLQAIGAGGQGWANFIIYVLLSPTVRRRFFNFIPYVSCKQSYCCKWIKKHMQSQQWTTVTNSQPVSYESTISTDSIAKRLENVIPF